MRAFFCFLLFFFLTSTASAFDKAIVLEINGAIGPATQDYIERGIKHAEKIHAALIILKIDTPGGLESATRNIINQSILPSTIPIVGFVTPTGARAASAGTYLMVASHIAAMSPGTHLGAASPVSLIPNQENKTLSTAETKAMHDSAAYLKSLAILRGRNAEWAELAVKKGVSITAEEAKKLNVIDDIARDDQALLQKINGRSVTVANATKKINTQQLQIETISADWHYQFLSFLTNPNIAYILMLIAMYGLFFELSNPGAILPGVAGLIALMLMLYAFQLMPVNYTGLALIFIGVMFMLLEVYVASFGALGIGGVIAFLIGSLMLFDWQDPNFRIALPLIISMSIVSIIFFLMVIRLALLSHRKTIVTGEEGIIGAQGVVIDVTNDRMIVRVLGEMWDARSKHMLKKGDNVRVTQIQGLTLHVTPMQKTQGD